MKTCQSENSLSSVKLDGQLSQIVPGRLWKQYIGMDSSAVPKVKYSTHLLGTRDFTHMPISLQPVFICTHMTKKKKKAFLKTEK